MKKSLIQTAVLSFGFQILIAKLFLFWLCSKYNNLSADSAAAEKAHILCRWRICKVFLQFTVNTGVAHIPFTQVSFQRTHLGSQSNNSPFPPNTWWKFCKGDLCTLLPPIVLCSSCAACDNIMAYFHRLEVQYWEIILMLKGLLQMRRHGSRGSTAAPHCHRRQCL